jgi:aspartate/methionine/tyrosine aminotransferase
MLESTIDPASPRGALREVPFMGVIWVVHEASKLGFVNGHPDWCNLGQGQPEVGPMAGAPPRIERVTIRPEDHAYGPLGGIPELKQRIADHYNRLFQRGGGRNGARARKPYGPENVAVAQGGRLALSRAIAALGAVNVGYPLPDYTAYEDMLGLHLGRVNPMPLRTRAADGFSVSSALLERAVDELGLSAFLFSNPCNPTGAVVQGRELERIVELARSRRLTLLLDEFYSHFVYTSAGRPAKGPVSAAAYVADPERDPVVIVDGLTKSFRYPGWRVGWCLGPSEMVETIARVASAMDGGPSRIAQRAAIDALEPKQADQETTALREVFAKKRNVMLERLTKLGVEFPLAPLGTFYCFGSLAKLRPPFDDAMHFFREALKRKVLTVPGEFFDVNPGKRRRAASPYRNWMRFSFGPPLENVELGLSRLESMVKSARSVRR